MNQKSKIKTMKDIDYVELFAKKLKEDASLFQQHKLLLEGQYQASISLFKNMFGEGEKYKKNARIFLKKVGVIK